MTFPVAQTSNTNTFAYWMSRTNELANAMSNSTLTTYATTNGNSTLNGTFTANVLVTNTISISNFVISNTSQRTTGTSAQLIDTYSMSTFLGAEYTVSVRDNVANNHYMTKFLTTHDTSSAYTNTYVSITTNSAVGVFVANTNGSNVQLYFTPVSANTTVRVAKVII